MQVAEQPVCDRSGAPRWTVAPWVQRSLCAMIRTSSAPGRRPSLASLGRLPRRRCHVLALSAASKALGKSLTARRILAPLRPGTVPVATGVPPPSRLTCASHPNDWARLIWWNHPRCQNKWHVVRFGLRSYGYRAQYVPNVGMARTIGQILVIQLLGHRRTCRTSPTGPMVRLNPATGMT